MTGVQTSERAEPKPEIDGDVAKATWQPRWTVDTGRGCTVGLTLDDGCYVVLLPNAVGQWRPTPWIPRQAAELIGALVGQD